VLSNFQVTLVRSKTHRIADGENPVTLYLLKDSVQSFPVLVKMCMRIDKHNAALYILMIEVRYGDKNN